MHSSYDRMHQPPMMMTPPQQRQHHHQQPYGYPSAPINPYYDSPYPMNYKYNNNANNNSMMMMNRMNNNNNNTSMYDASQANQQMFETQPQMLSFKNFLQSLNQNLTPEQATKRYNEYKNAFRKEQIEIFFDAHKEEEWFKFRYHPDESVKRKEEYRVAIKRRLAIFMNLYEKNFLDNVYADMDSHEELKRFICAVIIKLEDGSDEDLKVLEDKGCVSVMNANEIKNETHDEDGGEKEELNSVEVKSSNNFEMNSDDENADYDNIKSKHAPSWLAYV